MTVSRNFGDLADIRLVTAADWGVVGRLARERIIERTQAGRDENDQPFAPYSPGYAALKASIGADSTPNLQLSGDMLQSITVEADDTGVTLAIR